MIYQHSAQGRRREVAAGPDDLDRAERAKHHKDEHHSDGPARRDPHHNEETAESIAFDVPLIDTQGGNIPPEELAAALRSVAADRSEREIEEAPRDAFGIPVIDSSAPVHAFAAEPRSRCRTHCTPQRLPFPFLRSRKSPQNCACAGSSFSTGQHAASTWTPPNHRTHRRSASISPSRTRKAPSR